MVDNLAENKRKLINCVDRLFSGAIQVKFETLFLEKKVRNRDLVKFLGVNRSYVSRVVNGRQIPPNELKIKIAGWFGVDSRVIWE